MAGGEKNVEDATLFLKTFPVVAYTILVGESARVEIPSCTLKFGGEGDAMTP